jgi:two-component system, cell cycle sensor histidine kinase and response regulator CckA
MHAGARPLTVLHLEDSAVDAEHVQGELRRAGFAARWQVVETEAAYLAGLRDRPDLILSDFSLPQFDGIRAAQLLRQSGLDIPFILVSATIGEERAVEAMREGVTDYLLKDRLAKLGPVVRRALDERAAREEHRRLQRRLLLQSAALDAAANVITITDADGVILWVNPAFARLTGYEPHEAVGRTHAILKSGLHEASAYAELWEEIRRGRTVQREFVNRRKDGTLFTVDQTITPVRGPDGSVTQLIGIMSDVTEQRALREQVVQAQKMEVMGHLASGVAHDFNNILSVVLANAGFLLDGLAPDDPVRPFAEDIVDAVQRANGLTRQLLIFSRKHAVEAVPTDLNEVVGGMERMLGRLLDRTVALRIERGALDGNVLADAGYLGQVLLNLVINARDAMPDGGTIRVATLRMTVGDGDSPAPSTVPPGDYLVLEVGDTGCGIPEELQARIFDPFFTTKPSGKGTGLGLATSLTIARQFGGHLGLTSTPGAGSTFRLYLPRLAAPVPAVPSAPERPVGGSEALLVAEDDPTLRQVVTRTLEAQGYTVLQAGSGEEALRLAEAHAGSSIRLVITDMAMPGMTGGMLAERLKASDPRLKVLLTSGQALSEIADDCRRAGEFAFLPKPFVPATLLAQVRALLDA